MPVTPLLAGDPDRLGDHVLLGRLGAGGMGTVYLGRAPDGRSVAVKAVRAEWSADPKFLARFHSEVKRARQVPPFCTAAVLHDDLEHDPPYLVVEYVDGPSLADVVRESGPLTASEVYAVAVGVATALVAIHSAGVVHRDLKPANVLLAVGLPKVIDFGIARSAELSAELTAPDQVIGTIGYLAPECLDTGARGRIGPPADVFAWGVLVGYAATGHTPFGGDSPLATIGRILTQPPDLTGLPGSLRHLVAAALGKDPQRRPTANELLDTLLSAGRPDVPGPDMTPELREVALAAQASGRPARRWTGRAVAAALAVGLLAGAGIALARSNDRVEQQDRALVQRDLLNRAAEIQDADPGLALRLAVTAEAISPSERGRAAVTEALATGYDGELSPGSAVYTAEYRPDGAMVATGGSDRIDLWSVADHRFTPVASLRTGRGETSDLAFSPDGRVLASAGGRLHLWDVAGVTRLAEIDGDGWDSVQFSGDGERLLTVSDTIGLWDVRDRTRPRSLWRTAGAVTRGGARLSPDGSVLAGVAEGEVLTLWATPADGPPRELARIGDADAVIHVAFSPDGKLLAAATVTDGVRIYDLSDPARPRYRGSFGQDEGPTTTMAFDRAGATVAVGSGERAVALWSVADPQRPVPVRVLRRDGGWISSIDFTPDGTRLLTAGWQGAATSAALWRITPFAPGRLATIPGPEDRQRQVALSDADLLAVSSAQKIDFFGVRDSSRPAEARPPLPVAAPARLRLGGAKAYMFAAGTITDLSTAEPRTVLDLDGPVLDVDAERGRAAVLDRGTRVLIYQLGAGAEILAAIPASPASIAAFDPGTGNLVIAQDNGGTESALTTWDLTDPTSPARAATLGGRGGFQRVAAHAGTVVAAHRDVFTWTLRNGVPAMRTAPRPRIPGNDAGSLALTTDRALLALSSPAGTELWRLPEESDPILLTVLPGTHTSSTFSPDRPLLVTADEYGTHLWDIGGLREAVRDPRAAACRRTTGLTEPEWAAHASTLPFEASCP
ncbi:serine/threonine-protein kinase [Actinoplanes sp. NEAU-A12]|uniref:Serine/threonine-protein kinase n=1 Tax=Actinoplanes sandaracinus TaxID=3045177 RepID=A0ABT6WRQ6_9ACTN|nr:serine/threonine-protein kinase [Actinoplanes sandaracinus]MDI6102320.1 serine/threonine-protein kinase [Actinoplanes sandaracinus]